MESLSISLRVYIYITIKSNQTRSLLTTKKKGKNPSSQHHLLLCPYLIRSASRGSEAYAKNLPFSIFFSLLLSFQEITMLQFCSIKLSESSFPTSLVSSLGFNNRTVSVRLKSSNGYHKSQIFIKNIKCIHNSPAADNSSISGNSSFLVSCLKMNNCMQVVQQQQQPVLNNVEEKVHFLASEFKSLSLPIERVKRLLHYATLLPPFEESARIQENRIPGCTTMVWLEVGMYNNGLMRYRVDSDSEITKGFCSCLIWLFDGATPEEILRVKSDDLMEMNIGFTSRGHSRVNTWHNILINMQKRTQNLVSGEG